MKKILASIILISLLQSCGRESMTELICTEPGIGIELGTTFQVLSENGSEWEILLGNEYRRVNKRSGRVTGWKTPPKFECKDIQK